MTIAAPEPPEDEATPEEQGSKAPVPPRGIYSAEALVGIALTVGFGVFSIPFELNRPVRYLIAVIAGLATLAVFGRYPELSRWIVKWAVRVGPLIILGLIVVLLIVIFKPSLRISAANARVLVAGASGFVFRALQLGSFFSGRRERAHVGRSQLAAMVVILGFEFGFGCYGCLLVRGGTGGVAYTSSWGNCVLIGVATICVYQVTLQSGTRLIPAPPKDVDGPLPPAKPRHAA